MLLTYANEGEKRIILKTVNKRLEDMGFVQGETLKITKKNGNNFIIEIKGSKVAISEELSRQINVY